MRRRNSRSVPSVRISARVTLSGTAFAGFSRIRRRDRWTLEAHHRHCQSPDTSHTYLSRLCSQPRKVAFFLHSCPAVSGNWHAEPGALRFGGRAARPLPARRDESTDDQFSWFPPQVRRDRALHQHLGAAGVRRHGAARRHQSFRAHLDPERPDPQRRRFQPADGQHPHDDDGDGRPGDDLRAGLSGHGHVVGDVLGRPRRQPDAAAAGRGALGRQGLHGLGRLAGGAEALRRQAARRHHALHAGRRRPGADASSRTAASRS